MQYDIAHQDFKLPNPFMHSFWKTKLGMYMQTTKVNQTSVKHQQRFAHVF